MKITLNKMLLASTLAAAMAVGLAHAADAPRVGVRGAITAIDGDAMHVKVTSGEDVTVHLTKDTQVRHTSSTMTRGMVMLFAFCCGAIVANTQRRP